MWHRLIAALLAWALLGHDIVAGEVELTPEQAYQAGFDRLNAGQSELANAIADALLQRDPEEFRVLILKARAARNIGQFDEAAAAGRMAWQVAQTDIQKFSAAMVTAQALSSGGQRTRAQLWLRRAANVAPNRGSHALAARDFRYVRARNPWATQLSFNITPSSNINNGSARETTQVYYFGLPFEFQLSGTARALEGMEYSTGVATRYRFAQSATRAHDIVAQFNHRTYSLSADAKAIAPTASGSDFEFTQVALGYVFQGKPKNGLGRYTLNATVGHSWYGGQNYFDYLRLGGSQNIKLDDKTMLAFSGSVERQFGDASPDADIGRVDMRVIRQIGTIGRLSLSLGQSESTSTTDVSEYSERRTGLNFALANPILGAQVSLGLDWRHRDYPRSSYDPAGREDREASASLNMVFTGIERYGFNPTVSVHASQTDSSVGRYDSERLGLSLGVRSSF